MDGRLYLMIESLELMAMDYSEQISSLPSFVCSGDEVYMGFMDSYDLMDQLIDEKLMNEQQISALSDLNNFLSNFPRGPEIVSNESLEFNPLWAQARQKARVCLALFNMNQ